MERQLSENLLGKTLNPSKYLTLDTLGVVRWINLSSVCSCWAFFCRAEVAHPASIIICSHVAVMLSGIIIAVSAAHCRAVSIWPCAVSSHRAAIVESSVAVHLSGSIVAHGGAATPARVAISSISHCTWNTMPWHFTACCGVNSSSTHHFISATLYASGWRANCGASNVRRSAEISHWAAVVGLSWADHFSFTAHHWAGTPTISSIISSHTIFIWEAIVWHLTPLGIESSPTRQLFFPVAFGPHLFWTTVSQHGQWKN